MQDQLLRMLFHIPPGFAAMILIQVLAISRETGWMIFGIAAGVLIGIMDGLRLLLRYIASKGEGRLAWFWRVEAWVLRRGLLREHERRWPSAMGWYAAGICLTYALFPPDIVVPSLIILACGDPAARWWGTRHRGRRFANGKSSSGMTAFAIASMAGIVTSYLLDAWGNPLYDGPSARTIFSHLVGILVGDIVECVGGRMDNLLIPLAAGGAMWIIL